MSKEARVLRLKAFAKRHPKLVGHIMTNVDSHYGHTYWYELCRDCPGYVAGYLLATIKERDKNG